jgi:hypothetical protein
MWMSQSGLAYHTVFYKTTTSDDGVIKVFPNERFPPAERYSTFSVHILIRSALSLRVGLNNMSRQSSSRIWYQRSPMISEARRKSTLPNSRILHPPTGGDPPNLLATSTLLFKFEVTIPVMGPLRSRKPNLSEILHALWREKKTIST